MKRKGLAGLYVPCRWDKLTVPALAMRFSARTAYKNTIYHYISKLQMICQQVGITYANESCHLNMQDIL